AISSLILAALALAAGFAEAVDAVEAAAVCPELSAVEGFAPPALDAGEIGVEAPQPASTAAVPSSIPPPAYRRKARRPMALGHSMVFVLMRVRILPANAERKLPFHWRRSSILRTLSSRP